MHKEGYFGIAFELLALAVGLMPPNILPSTLRWGIIGICVIVGLVLITIGIRKKDTVTSSENARLTMIWECFNKLTSLILSLEDANTEDRSRILSDIEKERNEFRDTPLDDAIRDTLAAVNECVEKGMSLHPTIEFGLKNIRAYMNKNYKRHL